MDSILTVTSAAAQTRVTTLESLKAEIAISSTDEDSYLTSLLDRASAVIVSYIDVPFAQDGTRTLGRETLVETLRCVPSSSRLRLARAPIVSVGSVEVDGTALDPADFEIDAIAGYLTRLSSGAVSCWAGQKIVATYVAGWLMPGEVGRNLPFEIEDAAFDLIKGSRFNRSRDPALRSENILEGLYGYTLFDSFKTDGNIPPPVTAKLDPYRYMPAI